MTLVVISQLEYQRGLETGYERQTFVLDQVDYQLLRILVLLIRMRMQHEVQRDGGPHATVKIV